MKNSTHIVVLLDDSGSMWNTAEATRTGFNKFLKEQQDTPGDWTLTLVKFSTGKETVISAKNGNHVAALTKETYDPDGGSTSLYDSMAALIDEVGAELSTRPESERPNKVIFVTITDGQDNSSKKSTTKDVKEKIDHQTDKYHWQFLFLGANQDAVLSAQQLGIRGGAALTYAATTKGIGGSYGATTNLIRSMRLCSDGAAMDTCSYSAEDREAAR